VMDGGFTVGRKRSSDCFRYNIYTDKFSMIDVGSTSYCKKNGVASWCLFVCVWKAKGLVEGTHPSSSAWVFLQRRCAVVVGLTRSQISQLCHWSASDQVSCVCALCRTGILPLGIRPR
jgi:hypothetical protein